MRFSIRPLMAATALLAAGFAQAHNAWMVPSSTVLSKPDVVSVDAAVSNSLFVADHAPLRLTGLVVTAPDGSTIEPQNSAQLKKRSVFDLNLEKPGTYRVSLSNTGAFASWKNAAGETKRARGTAESLAKDIPADATDVVITENVSRNETFVSVGKPTALKPHGVGLEIAFSATGGATDHAKGDKSVITVMMDGKPVAAGQEVAITRGNSQWRDRLEEREFKTNEQGQITVDWTEAGMYWVEIKATDDKTSIPKAKQRRLGYVATLEVLP